MWCERFLTQPLYRVFFSAWLIMLAAPITPAIAQQELPDLLASPLVSEEQKAQFRLYERQLERLADIKGHIRRRVQQLSERIDALTVGEVSETLLQQAQVDTRKQQLRREELNHRLNASKVRIKALNQAIENLETRAKLFQNPARQQEETGWQGGQFWLDRQALAQRRFNLALEQKRRELLAIRLAAATQKLEMMELWKRRIENLLRLRYQEGDNVILGDIDGRLDLENVASFGRYVTLTLQLEQQADNLSEAQRRRLETERDIALDRSYLLAQKVLIRNATEALNNIENQIAASGMTSKTLIEHHQTVRQIEKELETLAGELAARAEVYGKERYLLRKRLDAAAGENRKVFRVAVKMSDNLLTELQQLQSELDQQQNRVDTIAQRLNARHAEVRSKELFERRPFIWGTEYWATLSDNLSRTPALLFYQMKISLSAIFNAVTRLGFLDWIVVITLETGLLLALMAFRFGLGRLERRLRTQSATPTVSRIVWMLRQVLQMNLLGIVLLLALIPLSWIVVIVPPSEEIVLMLVSVGVITKLASNLVWLLLNHPDLPRESRYPRVYWALCVTLWSGGLLIMLTALGYLSDLPVILLSALDRLFMLYLLLTALPVFWLLRVVRQRLLNYYGRRYWVNIVRLVSVVIPIFQILIGLAGMSGYLNLAWAGARQLLAFIAVLLGWLLSQQLLNDVAAALKQRAFDDCREVWSPPGG